MDVNELHELWFSLQRVASDTKAAADEALQTGAGIPLSWFLALRWLNRDPSDADHVTQSSLDAAVGLTPSGTSRLLRRIEDAGLIRRQQSDADRRSMNLELTAAGTEALRRAVPYFTEAIRKSSLCDLADDEGRELLSALRHVVGGNGSGSDNLAEELSLSGVLTWHTTDAILAADAVTIREALDPLVFAEAARFPSEEVIADLRVILTDMVRNVDSPEGFLDADARFHHRLADLCHNTLLRTLYQDIYHRLSSGIRHVESTEKSGSAVYLQRRLRIHADLIDAVARGDLGSIEQLSQEHRMKRVDVSPADQQLPA